MSLELSSTPPPMCPRKVIAFWNGKTHQTPDFSFVHRCLEMPLNYLGFDIHYHDIQLPLPPLSKEDGVAGVILAFFDVERCDPVALIDWAICAIALGKKVVILRDGGFLVDSNDTYVPIDEQNRLYERLGFTCSDNWVGYPLDYQVICADPELVPFEREYPDPLPGFFSSWALEGGADSFLRVGIPGKPESEVDLILIGPHGAYVAAFFENNYDLKLADEDPRGVGWYLNPFLFFEKVFEVEAPHPIPDTTTMAGRRIFYSTCDGDDWDGKTAIEGMKRASCAEVILDRIIRPHPEIPVSVGIIAAVLDPAWVGSARSREIARQTLLLPQVEAASHSYSHPFDWGFFQQGGIEKEKKYLYLYPHGSWQKSYLNLFRPKEKLYGYGEGELSLGYAIPRAYANQPFNLDLEISGAAHYIDRFAPADNQVHLLLWPGNGRPWEKPLELCYEAGLKNLGGGFVRMDPEYPSYLFVYPLGRRAGKWIQPYSSMNAENSYTAEWSGRFYGFQYLPATIQNTESPRRIKPIHLYYHSYSGEYAASINAILKNIGYIQSLPIIPVRASRFFEVAQGFYSSKIVSLCDGGWKIMERRGLQTLRFDHAKGLQIDFARSHGVIGQKEHGDSSYVYLDAAVEEPLIYLGESGKEVAPFLIESSWEVWNVVYRGSQLSFKARGWGPLFMEWQFHGKRFPLTAKDLSYGKVVSLEMEIP
ncbi:MAG: hypothetical protein KGI80_05030 [Verrucomicrobiota bacterium]|nr:hypothetical protein [Verrucomicrobiota bacterium]